MSGICIGAASRALVSGEIDFDEFVKRTKDYWDFHARKMTSAVSKAVGSKQDPAAWFDDDDMKQEMLIAAWKTASTFDAARNNSPASMIAFSSRRTGWKKASRALGQVAQKGKCRAVEGMVPMEENENVGRTLVDSRATTNIEDAAEARRAYRALELAIDGKKQRAVCAALSRASGVYPTAVRHLWEDRDLRARSSVRSLEQARVVFDDVVKDLGERRRAV